MLLDEGCLAVKAQASGGRHYREDYVDQNFDAYSVEYTFADGAKLYEWPTSSRLPNRNSPAMPHGSKGLAVISSQGLLPHRRLASTAVNKSKRKTWSGLACQRAESLSFGMGRSGRGDFKDLPYNEVKRGVEASLVTAMGRYAAHTGQEITYDEMLNSQHELGGNVDKLTNDGPAPVMRTKMASIRSQCRSDHR